MTIENFKGLRLDGRLLDVANKDVDYRRLLNKYILSKWYFYLLSFFFFVGIVFFYLSVTEPVYEIKSKLLITEGDRESGSPEDWLKRSLNFSTSQDNVYNEIQVLTSFALVNQVVKYLNLDINYYWEREFSTKSGYKNFPVTVSSYWLSSPGYLGEAFEVTPVDGHRFKLQLEGEGVGTYFYGREFANEYGSFCFQLNENARLDPKSTMYIQFQNPDAVTESYLRNLQVGFIDVKSTTLEIVLEDVIPQRGVDILENLIIRYHQIKNQENNRIANNTLNFIDDRLVDIGDDLHLIESGVENYKLDNNIASESTSDLQIVMENASQLSREKQNLQVQISVLESMKRQLDMSTSDFNMIAINLANADLKIQALVKHYNDKVLERRQMLETAQPSNPLVLSINQQLVSLRNSIYSAIQNMENEFQLQLSSLGFQYNNSVARLRSMPTKERQLTDKSRQKNIVEDLYMYLLQKKEETALALIAISINSILIDPPRSTTNPVAPNRMKHYFAGSFLGLALPFLLISFVELLKDSIQSENQLMAMVPNQSIIGLINKRTEAGRQIVMQQSRSLISDRFRSLRTNMQFLAGDEDQCIMVTSSTSREGKTFIAVNLAVSFAMKEIKTIIVDFDLRNAQVANYLEEQATKGTGISTFFSGKTGKVADIIHKTRFENLHYITAGPLPDFPDELVLTEEKLARFFGYLKENYDAVIIDTSPVGIISDAILLNKYISHTIYVVRVGVTKKDMVEKARDIFDQDHLVNPLLVLNGVKKGEVYGYNVK